MVKITSLCPSPLSPLGDPGIKCFWRSADDSKEWRWAGTKGGEVGEKEIMGSWVLTKRQGIELGWEEVLLERQNESGVILKIILSEAVTLQGLVKAHRTKLSNLHVK